METSGKKIYPKGSFKTFKYWFRTSLQFVEGMIILTKFTAFLLYCPLIQTCSQVLEIQGEKMTLTCEYTLLKTDL